MKQAVQELAGALVVELVGGDAGENLGEGELDAGAVVDGGQLEDGVRGVDSAMAGCGAAGGVVVVAEGLAAQGGRAAAAARGEDVTAEKALDGGLGGFGGYGWCRSCGSSRAWGGYPPCEKSQSIQKRHVKSGLESGLGLDSVWTLWRRLRATASGAWRVKCEGPAANRDQGTGNREQGTGNREQGTGNS